MTSNGRERAMRTGLGVGLLLAITGLDGLHAQSAGDFSGLKPGQVVRVRTIGNSRFETRLGGIPGDSAPVLFATAQVPFEAARVDSLWIRGRAIWTGAIAGAAVATPLSFAFWAWFCNAVSEGTGCDEWGAVALLAGIGGAGGALIGAGIGAFIPRWRLRYAREGEVTLAPMLGPGRVGLAVRF